MHIPECISSVGSVIMSSTWYFAYFCVDIFLKLSSRLRFLCAIFLFSLFSCSPVILTESMLTATCFKHLSSLESLLRSRFFRSGSCSLLLLLDGDIWSLSDDLFSNLGTFSTYPSIRNATISLLIKSATVNLCSSVKITNCSCSFVFSPHSNVS